MKYHDMGFDGALTESLAGPLVGGAVTQVGTLATALIWKDKPNVQKWAPAIGLGLGALVSGILAFRENTRTIGIAGLVTAALVAVPRQLENILAGSHGTTKGFGVITPESMQGYGLGVITPESMQGAPPVELLDSGNGSSGMQADVGASQPPVEMLGTSGFGAHFASVAR